MSPETRIDATPQSGSGATTSVDRDPPRTARAAVLPPITMTGSPGYLLLVGRFVTDTADANVGVLETVAGLR